MAKRIDLAGALADVDAMRHAFDLTRDGRGEDLLDAAVAGVAENCDAQLDPEGNRWPDLSPGYAARKARIAPGKAMGHLHDVMLSPAELAGTRSVVPDEAIVAYGITTQAKDEARNFGVRRPFWGFTAGAVAVADRILEARFDTFLR